MLSRLIKVYRVGSLRDDQRIFLSPKANPLPSAWYPCINESADDPSVDPYVPTLFIPLYDILSRIVCGKKKKKERIYS